MLSSDEERLLARSAAAGDAGARARLIEANVPLVRAIAHRFVGLGVPFGDLVQEGTIGLTQAVDRYEWRNGSRFGAYASWWIKQAIIRALTDQARGIRLPHYLVARRIAVRRAEATLLARLGREPTPDELAAESGLTPAAVKIAGDVAQIRESLNGPLGDGGGELLDTVADPAALDPADVAEELDRRLRVRGAVAALPQREREVIVRRFGFDGEAAESLGAIAAELGLARERVRQIEQHALATLAHRLRGESRQVTGPYKPAPDRRGRPDGTRPQQRLTRANSDPTRFRRNP